MWIGGESWQGKKVGEMERQLPGVKGNLEKLECDTGLGGGVGPGDNRSEPRRGFTVFRSQERRRRPAETRTVGTEMWCQGPGHGGGGLLGAHREGFASASKHFCPYLVHGHFEVGAEPPFPHSPLGLCAARGQSSAPFSPFSLCDGCLWHHSAPGLSPLPFSSHGHVTLCADGLNIAGPWPLHR